MERIALEEAAFCSFHILFRLLVNLGDTLDDGRNMLAKGIAISNAFRLEESAAQHFRHILFEHRLYRLFFFASQDSRQFLGQLLPKRVTLHWVSSQQRGNNRAGANLGGGLGKILEEVGQLAAPPRIKSYLFAGIHQDFINQNERGQVLANGNREKVNQQRLRWGAFSLKLFIVRVEDAQAFSPSQLEGQHAPGMLQPADFAIRPMDLHALFRVELVEG